MSINCAVRDGDGFRYALPILRAHQNRAAMSLLWHELRNIQASKIMTQQVARMSACDMRERQT